MMSKTSGLHHAIPLATAYSWLQDTVILGFQQKLPKYCLVIEYINTMRISQIVQYPPEMSTISVYKVTSIFTCLNCMPSTKHCSQHSIRNLLKKCISKIFVAFVTNGVYKVECAQYEVVRASYKK